MKLKGIFVAMRYLYCIIITILIFTSCSSKKQLIYIKGSEKSQATLIAEKQLENPIQTGDILKIDVQSSVPEAAIPYNKATANITNQNIQLMQLEGYLVTSDLMIDFPVLRTISVEGLTSNQLAYKISQLLLNGGHLTNAKVTVRRVNSKFTVLGEVRNPGTFSYFDENINVFQALGYAGDLTINGKRNNLTLIREENGVRVVYKLKLTDPQLLRSSKYYIKNNDVIIVNPNFSKVKSAGFIGNPSSIAAISSILLSITLLIINK